MAHPVEDMFLPWPWMPTAGMPGGSSRESAQAVIRLWDRSPAAAERLPTWGMFGLAPLSASSRISADARQDREPTTIASPERSSECRRTPAGLSTECPPALLSEGKRGPDENRENQIPASCRIRRFRKSGLRAAAARNLYERHLPRGAAHLHYRHSPLRGSAFLHSHRARPRVRRLRLRAQGRQQLHFRNNLLISPG